MRLSYLTQLVLEVNALIDTGKYNDISVHDIHNAIEGERLLRFLEERGGEDIDLSMHLSPAPDNDFEKKYEKAMLDYYGGYAGNESRKWGVSNSGLCLVIAWTVEVIRQNQKVPV